MGQRLHVPAIAFGRMMCSVRSNCSTFPALLLLALLIACSQAAEVCFGQQDAHSGQTPIGERPETSTAQRALPPLGGSKLPTQENNCFQCHAEPDLWQGQQRRLYIPLQILKADVHFRAGVNCHDCHGGNPQAGDLREGPHDEQYGFRAAAEQIDQLCNHCHAAQSRAVAAPGSAHRSIGDQHAATGGRDAAGKRGPLGCRACHGEVSHQLLAASDARSPLFPHNQAHNCGQCHPDQLASYQQSGHGRALYELGLIVTATCADCHGAHAIFPNDDPQSTMHRRRTAETCGKCHYLVRQQVDSSVHGRNWASQTSAAGQAAEQSPASDCLACHRGHAPHSSIAGPLRLHSPERCGQCHSQMLRRFAISLHGELTALGYAPAARCADCHGAHDVLPAGMEQSRVSSQRRAATCRQCHPAASENFVRFDPHADHTDAQRDPLLRAVYLVCIGLLIGVFSLAGVHSALWLLRGLIDVARNGRPPVFSADGPSYRRFALRHRVAHGVLAVSFLGLALTGLPLKYSNQPWAVRLAGGLGGFPATSALHRVLAVATFGCFAACLLEMGWAYRSARARGRKPAAIIFGPDSPVPNRRDLRDLHAMLRWFVGRGPKPTFERWTYWEKFDFWGAIADVVIIGGTGLVLWFPEAFCLFLPGTAINVAKVIHSTQALLATGFVFAIHFFNTHLRPEKFPADLSMLAGLVSERTLRDERPELLARWTEEGLTERLRVAGPSGKFIAVAAGLGFVVMIVGLLLLAAVVASVLSI